MKKNRFSIVAFIFLSMSMVNSLEAKTLQDVASEMGLKKREAIKVLNGVNLIIQTVKSKFHDIADSDVSYYQKTGKRGLINETYPLFKRGKNTKIQTSSLNHRGIHSRYLGNYLRDLANISAQNRHDPQVAQPSAALTGPSLVEPPSALVSQGGILGVLYRHCPGL